jgi:hypothetical protein
MNVLFLDVDGVLNNTSCNEKVSFKNLLILKEIINKTQCVIVISSTYKLLDSNMSYLWDVFNNFDININIHSIKEFPSTYDLLDLYDNMDRSDEIMLTLDDIKKKYNINNWVVVDDGDLLNNNQSAKLKDHFVKTDPQEGLTKLTALKILKIFNI